MKEEDPMTPPNEKPKHTGSWEECRPPRRNRIHWTLDNQELLDQGAVVTAGLRNATVAGELIGWLRNRGTSTHNFRFAPVDFQTRGLGIRSSSLAAIRENDTNDVINVAGAYAFGMSTAEAVRANVESAQAVAEFAATLPNLRRLVHLSGYRVGGQEPATEPWSQSKRRNLYKRLGALSTTWPGSWPSCQRTTARRESPIGSWTTTHRH
ncbi:hypothetical protein J2X01_001123 [Arthrobacter ginsengisoli]|uniref:Thioester reductase (TE) domain-containing protein n=1 Tax=Arthrobacter ginsengisoli TaxID=1356565 RepID=A0ABU1U9L1_9MICC|nr:SDR family oxidoreductase [Arthrobacter ginsengisoli]MDR7081842.1 hypothetical protein [Arthrobacter ginsengisoli]